MTPWLLLTVSAAQERAEDLPLADAQEPGLVVVVGDPGGRFADGPPRGEVTDDGERIEFTLADDGLAPDLSAGDGVYTTRIDYEQRGGQAAISVMDAAGEPLWADLIPIGTDRTDPTLKVLVVGDRATARVDTIDRVAAPATGSGGTVRAPPPPPAADEDSSTLTAAILGLVGIGVGFFAGLRRGRRRLPLAPVGVPSTLPAGLPPIRDRQQRLAVADLRATLIDWGPRLAAAGPVLLVPRAESRAAVSAALAGVGGVSWLTTERPEIGDILDAADFLSVSGRVVVLVEGAEAVEPPEAVESADAPLADLLQEATVDVVVLTESD